jgi:hypothetical protein
MSTRCWFVTLADESDAFVQVAWGTQVNLPDGAFLLETKGAHVDGHIATIATSMDEVHEVFEAFYAGDRTSWVDRYRWRPAIQRDR